METNTKGLTFLNSLEQWNGVGDFSLSHIQRVLSYLENPQDSFRSIHIAGTNGKGSVSVAVASILGSAGSKVGLTTSPHLSRINERIVIDGESIDDASLDRISLVVRDACLATRANLTFFEAITAAAFLAFREAGVDWGIIEVGLGGRLDATNVISRPSVVAITSIGDDHAEILGNSLVAIAKEKAGIIKERASIVLGEIEVEPRQAIIEIAKAKQGVIYSFGNDFRGLASGEYLVYSDKTSAFNSHTKLEILPSLKGAYQLKNMSVAAKIGVLCGASDQHIKLGLSRVVWPGRLEEISFRNKQILIDAAHNPAGTVELVKYLRERGLSQLPIIFGALSTKRWKDMVDLLIPFAESWSVLTPCSNKAVKEGEIEDYLYSKGQKVTGFGSDHSRFVGGIDDKPGKLLLTGSIYLIGSIRDLIGVSHATLWRRGE